MRAQPQAVTHLPPAQATYTVPTGLTFGGKWKTILGATANAEWHWADSGRKPPTELVKWLSQNDDPYLADVVSFLVPWAFWRCIAILRGTTEEPEEKQEEHESAADQEGSESASSTSGEGTGEARWAARTRQLRAAGGLVGVYVSWAVFAYFICTSCGLSRLRASADSPSLRFQSSTG